MIMHSMSGITYLPKIPYVKAIVDIQLESEPDTIFAVEIHGVLFYWTMPISNISWR